MLRLLFAVTVVVKVKEYLTLHTIIIITTTTKTYCFVSVYNMKMVYSYRKVILLCKQEQEQYTLKSLNSLLKERKDAKVFATRKKTAPGQTGPRELRDD